MSPSFAKDVAPIFAANCAGCHGANVRMGSLSLDTYEGVEKGGNHGKIIEPGKSAESRLYLMIAGKLAPAMPLSGKPLAEGDIEIIRKWIDGGAKAPTPDEAQELAARLAQPVIPDIKPKTAVKPQIGALAYRPDGKLLALGTYKEVRLVDPATAVDRRHADGPCRSHSRAGVLAGRKAARRRGRTAGALGRSQNLGRRSAAKNCAPSRATATASTPSRFRPTARASRHRATTS